MNEETPATVILIDDHPMLRSGIKHLLSMTPDLAVIAETGDGAKGIELAREHDPDLILLDLNMPGTTGQETLIGLRQQPLSGRIIVFTVSNHEEDITNAFKSGADGYLLKDMEPEDLLAALRQAAIGEMVLSDSLKPVLIHSLREKSAPGGERRLDELTTRERDVLGLIAAGFSNKTVANRLNITESTVKVHVKNLLKKLKLRSRVEAAVWFTQKQKDK
ncbi:MAG: two-component system response regulator NarL [Betaproteobacteria bacterium]|nr:two-component system response regulator NarL [Betaproteobacteria bacterium]